MEFSASPFGSYGRSVQNECLGPPARCPSLPVSCSVGRVPLLKWTTDKKSGALILTSGGPRCRVVRSHGQVSHRNVGQTPLVGLPLVFP